MPLSIFNNRIPAKDLQTVPVRLKATNERAELSLSIISSQDQLGVARSVRLYEDELVKCQIRFLVKLDVFLKDLVNQQRVVVSDGALHYDRG